MDERGRIRLPESTIGGLPDLYRGIARQRKEIKFNRKAHIERAFNAHEQATSILRVFGEEHSAILSVPFTPEDVRVSYLEAFTPPFTVEVSDGEPWEGTVQLRPLLTGSSINSLYRGVDVIARSAEGPIALYKVFDNNILNWQLQDASLDEMDQCRKVLEGTQRAFEGAGIVPKGHSQVAWVSSMEVPITAASRPSV